MVGPGKPIDTERYFVICPNVVGACMGTTGPASTNPKTGKPWGLEFPVITIRDMVRAQAMLLDHLGIDSLFSVAGGSMGGMQVLQWAASYPEARVLGAADRLRDAAFGAEHRLPRGRPPGGDGRSGMAPRPLSSAKARNPRRGLAVARMGAHITYLSDAALHRKFGRKFQDRENPTFSFDADFEVESYLRHQGISFVERFDANSYLYLTRAMDYFDLAADYDGVVANAFKRRADALLRGLVHQRLAVPDARNRAPSCMRSTPSSARVSFAEIVTDKGHDAFLLDEPELFAIVRGFLDGAGKARGLKSGNDHAVAPQARSHHGRTPRARRAARASTCCWSPRWWSPAPRCSTSAAATANCCAAWRDSAASTAAASSCRARASTNASPRASP